MLAGCGGSQPPIGATGAMPQTAAITAHTDYKTIFNFNGTDGTVPYGELLNVNGTLYGTTYSGGSSNRQGNFGTVFKITTSGVETVLYSFKGGADGVGPSTGLTEVNGMLYGTTIDGGDSACSPSTSGCGTIFEISPSGHERVLHRFKGAPAGLGTKDGAFPGYGWSMADVNGTLYGTTILGGATGHGAVFQVTTSGKYAVLYSFGGGDHQHARWDGAIPYAGVNAINGVLYGTTSNGGGGGCYGDGCGTVFSVSTSGKERLLHRYFYGPPHGRRGGVPYSGLTEVDGTLYGTTALGGAEAAGSVFKMSISGGKTPMVYSFKGSPYDGAAPTGTLIRLNGALYGTTIDGGARSAGAVFEVTPSAKETMLHSFGAGTDGAGPDGTLIVVNGTIFGTTSNGGAYGDGTVFALKP